MSELPTVPVTLRVHLAHATVQAIADAAGADILHLKGPALDPALGASRPPSTDADVLVRPAHLELLFEGLALHGWQHVKPLRAGGLVQHSANWYHGELGQLDVHVRFPGIQADPARAFDALWQDRQTTEIAHRPCVVPDLVAQRLVLLLHAARDLPRHGPDVQAAWLDATPADRDAIQALAEQLDAEVALAAATGRLDLFRGRPEYALWRLYADGTTTTSGFRRLVAEVRAAPEGFRFVPVRVLGYGFSALLHMPQRVANQLARRPEPRELAQAYARFLRRGADVLKRRPRD